MQTGTASAVINCDADEFLAFVRDVERYREVDDKIGPIDWVRNDGDVTEFRFRPKMPGLPFSPKVVSRMVLTPGKRIDIAYAPKPHNQLARLLSSFSAYFECEPAEGGTRVTRSISMGLPGPLRPLEGLLLGRHLRPAVERELELASRREWRTGRTGQPADEPR